MLTVTLSVFHIRQSNLANASKHACPDDLEKQEKSDLDNPVQIQVLVAVAANCKSERVQGKSWIPSWSKLRTNTTAKKGRSGKQCGEVASLEMQTCFLAFFFSEEESEWKRDSRFSWTRTGNKLNFPAVISHLANGIRLFIMSESKSTNIVWHNQSVDQNARWKLNQHKGCVCWFTGLSGAGKSSVANCLEVLLNQKGIRTYLLDGDNIRHGLCKDLGFSAEDRVENIRRVGQVSKLMADAGVVVLTALISPYRSDRDGVRDSVQDIAPFHEVYVKASLSTCESRDPKGLYQMAREGKIKNFTGIDDPYEEPLRPDLVLDSDSKTVEALANEALEWLESKLKL